MLGLGIKQFIENFTPETPSHLAAWYRADFGVNIVSGTVTSWSVKGGTANPVIQATTANQPTFSATGAPNNQPCLNSPDGLRFLASVTAFTLNRRGWTAIMVFKCADTTVTSRPFANGDSWGMQIDAGGTREIVLPGIADEEDSTMEQDVWEYWTIQDDGTNQFLYVNGVLTTISPNNSTPIVPVPESALFSSETGGLKMTGSIAEVVVYAAFLPAATLGQLDAYINNRYGFNPMTPIPAASLVTTSGTVNPGLIVREDIDMSAVTQIDRTFPSSPAAGTIYWATLVNLGTTAVLKPVLWTPNGPPIDDPENPGTLSSAVVKSAVLGDAIAWQYNPTIPGWVIISRAQPVQNFQ